MEDYEYLVGDIRDLFTMFSKRVMNLDPSVSMAILKRYIAFKTTTNFVDVVPMKSFLRLHLNMAFDEILDPTDICIDVSNNGYWGNGEVKVNEFTPRDDELWVPLEVKTPSDEEVAMILFSIPQGKSHEL